MEASGLCVYGCVCVRVNVSVRMSNVDGDEIDPLPPLWVRLMDGQGQGSIIDL